MVKNHLHGAWSLMKPYKSWFTKIFISLADLFTAHQERENVHFCLFDY